MNLNDFNRYAEDLVVKKKKGRWNFDVITDVDQNGLVDRVTASSQLINQNSGLLESIRQQQQAPLLSSSMPEDFGFNELGGIIPLKGKNDE